MFLLAMDTSRAVKFAAAYVYNALWLSPYQIVCAFLIGVLTVSFFVFTFVFFFNLFCHYMVLQVCDVLLWLTGI